jgi:hypothetical protein
LTIDNVEEYTELLPKVILVDAVSAQLEAFRNGFRSVACGGERMCEGARTGGQEGGGARERVRGRDARARD